MRDATHICFVTDESGSMHPLAGDVIGGFNTFLEEQKAIDKPATFSHYMFNTEVKLVSDFVDIQEVKPLSSGEYKPNRCTALLDCLGRAITETGTRLAAIPEDERPDKVLFVIFTDGLENASIEYKKDTIKSLVTEQSEKFNWQFIYLGANQDAFAEAQAVGIRMSANTAASAVGTRSSYQGTSAYVSSLRETGAPTFDPNSFTEEEVSK